MSDDGLKEALRLQGWSDAADLIEQYENEKVLSKLAYDSLSSLLLSVQRDCIAEHKRANALDAKLAKAIKALQAADLYIYDLNAHEGAEGFSVSTAEAAAVYHNALAELEE